MILQVFSVFDSKMAEFGQPFFNQKEQGAIRAFSDAVRDGSNPNNMWHVHPEDFSLFYIGEFNTESGEFDAGGPPLNLITASAIQSVVGTKKIDMKEEAVVN